MAPAHHLECLAARSEDRAITRACSEMAGRSLCDEATGLFGCGRACPSEAMG